MEKPIVRESKFRNVFSKSWKKELNYTNLKVNLSGGGDDLFKANATFFAVPWMTAGGGVAVIPVASPGKAPDSQPLLSGHTDGITAIDFSPFDDHTLATGSRDNTVKIWKIPEDGLKNHISTPVCSISQPKKVTALQYHPIASNLLFTGGGDFSAKLWDMEKVTDAISLTGHSDIVTSVAWNTHHKAQLMATSCKDKKLRVFDPRANTKPIQECVAHEGVQGFRVVWADNNDFDILLTVGFSKVTERYATLWDPRKLSAPLHSTLISGIPGSSTLIPFYDPATNVVYFTGKGDLITYYELDKYPAALHHLNKAQFSNTHSTVCLFPKRVCDAGMCEIDRFLRLTNNTVETASFIVPRKTQATHFQVDIFPPAPSGEAGLTGARWLSGTSADFPTTSMKPLHLTEDALPISPPSTTSHPPQTSSAGGVPPALLSSPSLASLPVAPGSGGPPVLAGSMLLEVKGWFLTTYEPKYFSISANQVLYCFANKESAAALFSVPLASISEAKTDPNHASRFTIMVPTGWYNLEAYNQTERDKWMRTLTNTKAAPPAAAAQELHSGNLVQHVSGYFWDTNEERRFVVSGGVLNAYKLVGGVPDTSLTVEAIYVDKIIGVHVTEAVFEIAGYSFQVSTATRILHLLAHTADERHKWMKVLGKPSSGSGYVSREGSGFISRTGSSLSLLSSSGRMAGSANNSPVLERQASSLSLSASGEQPESIEEVDDAPPSTQLVLSGWGQRRTAGLIGMLGLWGKCYISLIGEDLFSFKDMRSAVPDLRLQLGNVKAVRALQAPTEFQLELTTGESHYFRAISTEDREAWVEALESSRKRAVTVGKLLKLVSEGDFDEEEAKKNKNLLEPHRLKTGDQKLLMQIKGKRRVRVCTVAVSARSLNTNNAFVLDAGTHLYIWMGARSSRVTRAKALDLANRIKREERSARADIVNVEEGKTDQNEAFWKAIGGKLSTDEAAKLAQNAQSSADQDKDEDQTLVYWIGFDPVTNAAQLQVVDECINRLPKKEIMHTTGVFVVDTGSEVFCWTGKTSGARQRKHGLKVALGLAEGRDHVVVARVLEFGEANIFKEKFGNYPGMLPISTTRQESSRNIAASRIELKVQDLVQRMLKPAPEAALDPIVAKLPEESRMTIWRIEEFEKVPHPRNMYGQFFMGESYIIHYAYTLTPGGKDQHIVFFFIGRDCPTNDKGTAAYLVVELDETLGSMSTQVRVVQDKEPAQFLAIFKGKYIVHAGKSTDYIAEVPKTKTRLYDIRGNDDISIHAVECDLKSTSLHSGHSFVLQTPKDVYAWIGKYAPSNELAAALSTATMLSPGEDEHATIEEGSEPEEFWAALGGKGRYFTPLSRPSALPRLFLCTNASGRMDVEPEAVFAQEDLAADITALLDDAVSSVYIWLGKRSAHAVRKVAMELAIEFSARCKAAGNPRKVYVVQAYHEPLEFKCHFRPWSIAKYPKAKDAKGKPIEYYEIPPQPVEEVLQDYLREVYPYQDLLGDVLPPGIDVKKLESYLSDEDFEKVFHMTRQEFEKIPQWKRENVKREVFLY